MTSEKKPRVGNDPIDLAVGARVRDRRVALGISQSTLAEALQLTFQQVQKYERGANRISVPMLVRMAPVLQTTPAALLEGITPKTKAPRHAEAGPGATTDRETLETVRVITGIADPAMRRKLRQLATAIGDVERSRAA